MEEDKGVTTREAGDSCSWQLIKIKLSENEENII
jgi:hypothetical protein